MRRYLSLSFCLFISLIQAQEQQAEVLNEPMEITGDSLSNVDFLAQNKLIDTVRIDTTLIDGKAIALIDHIEVSEFDKKWLESWKNNVIDSSLVIKPEDTLSEKL